METGSLVANNEAGFKALFTHATVGIIIVNSSGSISHANPFVCQMLGYDADAFVGSDISILIPASLRNKHNAHLSSYFKNPVGRPMGLGMELMAVKSNGEHLPVEISLCSYTIGTERYAVAFITDITLKREKETGYARSQFVSLASHEFRTPLSTILSSASLIGRYNENIGSENIYKHTLRIKSAVTSLTHILNDFLSLDKLEQGAVQVNAESFHLLRLITEVSDELEHYLKQGQIIQQTHSGEEMVYTDKNIVKNVLLNLISNASKYSDEHATIEIKTSIEKDTVSLEVTDHGIGIPKEELKKLFSLFYRGSNVGTIKGTGLGLNIVSKYVTILGGEISVSSVEDAGSTFRITLPIRQNYL